jgi:carbon monoxide dehydrogenase subunit G
MPSVTVSVDIEAPLASVWEAAADLANHGQWMADVESIGFDSEARQGPGTVMRVATKVGPFRTTDVMKVTSWETGRRISVEHRGLFTGRGEFQLSAVGGATRFTWSEEIDFPWRFGGPIGAAFARPILALIWRGNLRRLKALLET